MAGKLQFDLVAPEALIVSEAVDMVVIPGGDGDFGVLPRHAPLVSTVRPGVIVTYEGEGSARQPKERIFVAGGFAEVTPDRLTVLAEQAMKVGEIDRAKTELELKDASEDLADAKDPHAKGLAERAVNVAKAKLAAIRG